ncbi:cysteine desulfurase family protein [Dermabacteraceae bacterium CCM 9519]
MVRHYLDHAATSPLHPQVREPYLRALESVGNPSALHSSGRRARTLFADAIDEIAQLLGVPSSWVILTCSGTEADNLALRGVNGEVVTTATEHPAVLETVQAIGGRILPVSADGTLTPDALAQELAARPASLVSVHAVNNETGVVQDVSALAEVAHSYGARFHTDAVQAIGHIPLDIGVGTQRQLDLVSLSGHKIGAPVGVGALLCDPDLPLTPHMTGGGQQRQVRSGTLDAPGAVALAAALRVAVGSLAENAARYEKLARELRRVICEADDRAVLTAADAPHAPHIVHACVPDCNQDALLFVLDSQGIDASGGSACQAGVTEDSHVLRAMGYPVNVRRGAIRFSFGHTSGEEDVSRVANCLPEAIRAARRIESL